MSKPLGPTTVADHDDVSNVFAHVQGPWDSGASRAADTALSERTAQSNAAVRTLADALAR